MRLDWAIDNDEQQRVSFERREEEVNYLHCKSQASVCEGERERKIASVQLSNGNHGHKICRCCGRIRGRGREW